MTTGFLLNTRAEVLKCRNTPALWLTITGSAFIPFINVIKFVAKPDYFVPLMKDDPWGVFVTHNWQIAASFLMVMYVILVTSFIVQIEYTNNTWKQVYASPRSYADIFFSKLITVHLMLSGCFVLFNLFILAGGHAIELMQDRYAFSIYNIPWREMAYTSFKMYASVQAIVVIQYWLALRFPDFAISMGIGMALYIIGLMIRQWECIHYYPYMFPFLVYFNNPGLPVHAQYSAIVHSLIYSVAGMVLGFAHVARVREKG